LLIPEQVVAKIERAQAPQFGSGRQAGDVLRRLVEAGLADRRQTEYASSFPEGILGVDAHPFDQSTHETPLAHPRPQWGDPVFFGAARHLLPAIPVLRLPQLVAVGPGALHLDADELAARVVMLIQPVGKDQA